MPIFSIFQGSTLKMTLTYAILVVSISIFYFILLKHSGLPLLNFMDPVTRTPLIFNGTGLLKFPSMAQKLLFRGFLEQSCYKF